MEYTGDTVRLPTLSPLEHEAEKGYEIHASGDQWVITAPPKRHMRRVETHEQTPGIPIPDRPTYAVEGYTARHTKPHNDILMACLAIAIGILALVTLGGYDTLESIPMLYLIPVVLLTLIGYGAYRMSRFYYENGARLERFMRDTHDTSGRVNKRAMFERIVKGK